MEAPPPLSPAPTAAATAAPYLDSIGSSPRSLRTDCCADHAPILPQKLRFMCSYGGHIIPRPHDKSLCYIGGDTRIIVIDRNTSLSDLHHRLSKTLLHNQPFLLKYQLPNEDLDALISVTAEEDLEIMVEEYDRLSSAVVGGGSKPGRLRLFLFPKSPSNIDQLLVETASSKSEDWFLNALNGKANPLSAAGSDLGFSESSSVNCLLGLDDGLIGKVSATGKDVECAVEFGSKNGGNENGNIVSNHEVHSIPDSPMLENTSSFGSTSSSPTSSNLPPIKVHAEENPKTGGLGIEERFQQMGIGVVGNVNNPLPLGQNQDEVGGFGAAGGVVSGLPVVVGGDCGNRAFSDDERSDHGGYRKVVSPPTQLVQPNQIAQFQQKQGGVNDFPSPDSVSSEGSVNNPLSRQRQAIYQEPVTQILSGNYNAISIANPVDSKIDDQNSSRFQMQPQVQDSAYVLSNQYDQNRAQVHQPQQFVHTGAQYIPAGAVPIASYYPIYPTQQQHHPHQPELDQQYPVYFMPARQAQAYNLPLQQTNYSELAPTSIHPQTSSAIVTPHSPFNLARNAPATKPEIGAGPAGVYRTAATVAPQLVPVPPSQHQAQYVGFTQIHHPSQPIAPSPAANSTYAYEFADPARSHIYYAQHLPPQFAAQYQSLSAAPAAALPESSAQLENIKRNV